MNELAGLGRRQAPDDRDLAYPMRALVRGVELPIRKMWKAPAVLDQGATSQCVAYSGLALLSAGPVVNRIRLDWTPTWLYRQCQLVDEWPGEDYDGTSVRALMKVLQRERLLESYVWAQQEQDIRRFVLTRGPVVMGTDWHMEMFTPDRWGYIRPEGQPAGGHAWLVVGCDVQRVDPLTGARGAYRMQNSWGVGWGERGRAWVNFADMERLLQSWGEAGAPVEIKG